MITCLPVTGLGEVSEGDDLAGLITSVVGLRDGDVLVVTSKIVSKAEGRVVRGEKTEVLDRETDRVLARRGPTAIVRTHHGLVMAAAGVDASNTEPGTLVLLPADPDASARRLREAVGADGGPNVAVLVSDTSGRAWRNGQTDIAIGAAGIEVLDDHAGRDDGYGNLLAVTAPALADEITAAADLVTGKLSRSPAALVRGLERLVLPHGQDGPGALALVREESQDMFGLGSREAVLHALLRDESRGYGRPASSEDVASTLEHVSGGTVRHGDGTSVDLTLPAGSEVGAGRLGALEERAVTIAFALGWRRATDRSGVHGDQPVLRFVPVHP